MKKIIAAAFGLLIALGLTLATMLAPVTHTVASSPTVHVVVVADEPSTDGGIIGDLDDSVGGGGTDGGIIGDLDTE